MIYKISYRIDIRMQSTVVGLRFRTDSTIALLSCALDLGTPRTRGKDKSGRLYGAACSRN